MIHDRYKKKGLCVGPMGFPQKSEVARQLEAMLKQAEKEGMSYKRQFVTRLPLTVEDGERADISTISSIDVDRDGEVVLASGAELKQFQANPVVTFGHDYSIPPVGRAQWIKFEPTQATATSIKAKTEYAPEGLYDLADVTWGLVKAGFLVGKSVGFLPTELSPPTTKEIDASEGRWAKVSRVIRKWTMYEYSVATVPSNPSSLVEAVAKGQLILPEYMRKAMGLDDQVDCDLWEWDEPEPPMPKFSKAWRDIETEIFRKL
jgi:hypothetical protein